MGLRTDLRNLRRMPPIDWDVAEQVCMMIEAGTSISKLGDIAGMPPYWVVNYWRREHPEFDAAVVAASEALADRMMEATIEIADDVQRSPACREVSIRARQFAMRVLNRRKYDPATRVIVDDVRQVGDGMSTAELEALVREERRARLAAEAVDVEEGGDPPLLRAGGLDGD
jgi:hypothetical protein